MPSVCIDEEDPTLWRERAKRRIERERVALFEQKTRFKSSSTRERQREKNDCLYYSLSLERSWGFHLAPAELKEEPFGYLIFQLTPPLQPGKAPTSTITNNRHFKIVFYPSQDRSTVYR